MMRRIASMVCSRLQPALVLESPMTTAAAAATTSTASRSSGSSIAAPMIAAPLAAATMTACSLRADRWLSHSFATTSGSSSTSTSSGSGADGTTATPPPAAAADGDDRPPPREDLVDRYLSPDLMSRAQRLQLRVLDARRAFSRFEGDSGSPEVQAAVLSERIRDLMEHLQSHKKDHAARWGLRAMLHKRRRVLSYLRRRDFESFAAVVSRLGLRDAAFARQARADKYRVGSRLGAPAESVKRYGFR